MLRFCTLALAVAAALLSLTFREAAAAPSNDSFSSPATASPLPYLTTVDTTTATMQTGEPHPCSTVAKTVWYRFTAPASGKYIINTYNSSFDTVLAVYTGSSLTSLSTVACVDDTSSSTRARVELTASAGVAYMIQAGGYNGAGGTLVLDVRQAPPPPPNDAFANAISVSALPFANTQLNYAATTESGEKKTTCSDLDKTVWYKFTPPTSGDYVFETTGSDFDTVLTVYSGTSLSSLAQIGCDDDISTTEPQSRVQVTLSAGASYRVQAGGFSGARGGVGADYGTLVLRVTGGGGGGGTVDSDGDGCSDAREVGADHTTGGQRDPANRWDFFDVTGDRVIDTSDVLVVMAHFGHGPSQDSTDQTLDRYTPDLSQPWRTAEANDGVNTVDALAALRAFGDSCL